MCRQTSNWITRIRRFGIYLRDDFTCCYCGTDLHERPLDLSLDHLVARSTSITDGGRPDHRNGNLVTCCKACNSSRGNRSWRTFAPGGAQARIERQVEKPLDLAAARLLLDGEARVEAR